MYIAYNERVGRSRLCAAPAEDDGDVITDKNRTDKQYRGDGRGLFS